jgi:hypothetical protein
VDGVLFESFSVRWVDAGDGDRGGGASGTPGGRRRCWSCTPRSPSGYSPSTWTSTPWTTHGTGLADFARRRARLFGLHSFISDRALRQV